LSWKPLIGGRSGADGGWRGLKAGFLVSLVFKLQRLLIDFVAANLGPFGIEIATESP
jgi:hypothetical protein